MIEKGKRLLENRIVQGVIGFASIAIISWLWSGYHTVNAMPDALDTLDSKVEKVQEEQKVKATADSLLFIKEVEEVKEAVEKVDIKLRAVEDAQLEYNIRQEAVLNAIEKILGKLDED